MTTKPSQQSNSFSTGGGGVNFEKNVQAYFTAFMLMGGHAPVLPNWPIKSIKLQGRYDGYETDDCIVFAQDPKDDSQKAKLLVQIKHVVSITEGSNEFSDVIHAAWRDFCNPKFNPDTDYIALITGPLTKTDTDHTRRILDLARYPASAADFFKEVNVEGFSSKEKTNKLAVFRHHLEKANENVSLDDEIFWRFLKCFHLLGMDLDTESGVKLAEIKTMLSSRLHEPSNAHDVWNELFTHIGWVNQNAGTISFDTLPTTLVNKFKPLKSSASADIEKLSQAYLDWIIENNLKIKIPLLEKAEIQLNDVYVALKGRLSDTFNPPITNETLQDAIREVIDAPEFKVNSEKVEMDLTRTIHSETDLFSLMHGGIHDVHEKSTDIVERELLKLFPKNIDQTVTLGEAFRRERRLVILGEPGSGKTTLLKWLAVILSNAFLNSNTERVEVPLSKIDPEADDNNTQMDDLGIKRIPIFIRVAAFRAWRKTNPDKKQVLGDYIGYHLAQNADDIAINLSSGKSINLEQLNIWLTELIKQRKTILLIDGLDEVDNPAERGEIVKEIDGYLDYYLRSDFSKLDRSEDPGKDWPVTTGGNQVIITSRVVGYRSAHLSTRATHLTIEPMSEIAIKRFCKKYVIEARRTYKYANDWLNKEQVAIEEAEQFILCISKLREKGVHDLTSNPVQLSILAALYLRNNAQLPEQRTQLYQAAIEEFLKHCDERIGKVTSHEKTLKVLSQLAAEMLGKSSLGFITDTELKSALENGGISVKEIEHMLMLAGEGIGLLSMRAPGVYSFLHLTFQEYLAGTWLLSQSQPEAEFLKRIDSARWREALLMALGQQALTSAKELDGKLELLVKNLLNSKQNARSSCSTTLLLIASALREMDCVPDAVIHDLVKGMINAYSNASQFKQFPQQLRQLESAFCQLSNACKAMEHSYGKLQEEILNTLEFEQNNNKEYALACVRLVTVSRIYTSEIAELIYQLLPFDDENLDWSVDKALSDIVSTKPLLLPKPEGSLLYELAEENPEWIVVLEQSTIWRRLCILLYGGLNSYVLEKIEQRNKVLNDIKRNQEENNNTADSDDKKQLTESLDKERSALEAELKELLASRNKFSASRLHRDSSITPFIIDALAEGREAKSLIEPLLKKYQEQPLDLQQSAEIMVALFALDYPVISFLQQNLKLQEEVLRIFGRVHQSLVNAIQAAAPLTLQALGSLSNQLPDHVWQELMGEIIELNLLYDGVPITVIELLKSAPDNTRIRVMAEQWQYFMASYGEDPLYNMAVVLDTVGNELAPDSLTLAHAFSLASHTATQYWKGHPGWFADTLARKPRTDRQYYAMALEVMAVIPQPLQFIRGWVIEMLAPGLLEDKHLKLNALWITLCLVPDQFNARNDALQALGVINNEGILSIAFHKMAKQYPRLVVESNNTEKPVAWEKVINELNSLPLVIQKNRSNRPNYEILDDVFALERSITDAPTVSADMILSILQMALKTNDCENIALLLIRLSFYIPFEIMSVMLCAALRIIDLIQDMTIKASLIKDAANIAQFFSDTQLLHGELVNAIESETLKLKASNYSGVYLNQQEIILNNKGGDATPLILGSRIHNLKYSLGYSDNIEAYWVGLAAQELSLKNAGDGYLDKIKRISEYKSVRLTRLAALSLEILRVKSPDNFLTALSLVEYPEPETRVLLIRWYELGTEEVKRYCSLLFAEIGYIRPETITDMIALLDIVEDRIRYRIAIIFYVEKLRKEQKLRVTQLGAKTLETLAEKCNTQKRPDIRQALGWAFEHIIHDDADALRDWAYQLDNKGSLKAAIENTLIARISYIDDLSEVWPTILNCLQHGSIDTKQALARSICVMLAKGTLSKQHWHDIERLIQDTNGECLGLFPVIEEVSLALAESIVEEAVRGADPTAFASVFLKRKTKPLSEWATELANKNPEELKRSLTRIGDNCLASTRFTERVASAAKFINNANAVNYLIDAMFYEISTPLKNDGLLYFGSELLSLLAATIETYPDIFYQVIGHPTNEKSFNELQAGLSKQLPKLARKHNTFTGRQAALLILSYLRRVTPEVCEALQYAMLDVPPVQEVALASIERYRYADKAVIDKLKPILVHKSTVTAYMAGLLMSRLARNKYLESTLRDSVITALRLAAENPENDRELHLFESLDSSDNYQIRHIGKLNQLFLAMVDDLTGASYFSNTDKKRN
ncbi:MAG: hypothetical protein NTY50_01020 [Methylobacter sp.]|nr:hypothetical protein [Methylobacter sp.]